MGATTNPQLQLRCEIGFTDSPTSAIGSVTWTDVTSYLRLQEGVNLFRGRQDETSYVGAGTAFFALNNRDGRFTPGNTSGAYSPNVKLRRPVRFSVAQTVAYDSPHVAYDSVSTAYDAPGTFTTIWTGYVDEWIEGWNNGVQPVVRVRASDLYARLNNRTMRPLVIEGMLDQDPVLMYALNDSAGSTTAGDQSANPEPEPLAVTQWGSGGTAVFGEAGGLPADPDLPVLKLTRVDATNGKVFQWLYTTPVGLESNASTMLACFLYLPVSVSGTVRVAELYDSASNDYLAIDLVSNVPQLTGRVNGVNKTLVAGGSPALNDGAWHLVSVDFIYNYASSGVMECAVTVDGARTGGTVALGGTSFTADTVSVGGKWDGSMLANAWLSCVTAWGGSSSFYPSPDISTGGGDGGAGDDTIVRAQRILSLAGMGSVAGAGSYVATMAPQPFDGQSAASLLNGCADAEGAPVYIKADGTLYVQTVAQRTSASAVAIDAKYVDSSTGFSTSDALLVNSVTYSRPAGATISLADTASITANGKQPETKTIYVNSDAQLSALATALIAARKDPLLRTGALTVDLTTTDPIIDAADLLAVDIGGVLRVDNVPRGSGDDVEVWVEGIGDVITPVSWRRTWNTSPKSVA